ncbi:FixH family protein [Parahaliea mediterranea]|uniref:FixH family protein n=1 Tax=Parahaliea mediterranea TaxID=651086 RepID=A0A939DHC2_9GAMM|nr:FixH family protein [Parahaliea mediterranea]MBN7798043.1 FixH family protein [Parahaliea mediterranea]
MHASEGPRPWYRQFWPWFLMALPACAVVASLWTVYIAHRDADDLVVDDYYKDGLAINRQLEKRDYAERAGIAARVRVDGDDILVTVSGPVRAQQLALYLSHPIESDRDIRVTLQRASRDSFRARLPAPPAPRWHWVLDAGPDSRWRLDGSLSDANFSDVRRP